MAQAMAEEFGKTPMSPALQATLMRARDYASSQSHNQVTVEHLLLALSEDEDAAQVLKSCQIDMGRLRRDVAGFLGDLNDRSPGSGPSQPTISAALAEILQYATLAAKQGRRARIDGAIVLAALVGEGRSMAASFLTAQGLTFEEAIRVLQRGMLPGAAPGGANPGPRSVPMPQIAVAPTPPAASSLASSAEDILAAARERIESRTLPPRAEPLRGPATREPAPRELATREPAKARIESVATAPPLAPPAAMNEPSRPAPSPETFAHPRPDDRDVSLLPPPMPLAPPRGAPGHAMSPAELSGQGWSAPDWRETERTAPVHPAPPATLQENLAVLAKGTAFDREASGEWRAEQGVGAQRSAEPQLPGPGRTAPATWAPPPLPMPPLQSSQYRSPLPPQAPGVGRVPMPAVPAPIVPGPPDRPGPDRAVRQDLVPAAPWSEAPQRPATHLAMPRSSLGSEIDYPGFGSAAVGSNVATHPYAPVGPGRAPLSANGPVGGPTPQATARGPVRGAAIGASSGAVSGASGTARQPAIESGQVSHTIPAQMQQGRPVTVEVHVARSVIAGSMQQASPLALRSEVIVARAITVRLRGPRAAFAIEAGSPETQWDQAAAGPGRAAGEAAVWRFTVTPMPARTGELHVTIAARTLAADGLIADTGLPDVVVPVRIARDVGKVVRRWAGFIGIAVGSFMAALAVQAVLQVDVVDAVRRLAGP